MNHRNWLIRLEYRVAVSSHYRPTFIQSVVFAERMLDAPCVTIQKTLQNILQITCFNVHVCQTSTCSDSDSDSDALYLAHWPFKMKTYRCIHNITS